MPISPTSFCGPQCHMQCCGVPCECFRGRLIRDWSQLLLIGAGIISCSTAGASIGIAAAAYGTAASVASIAGGVFGILWCSATVCICIGCIRMRKFVGEKEIEDNIVDLKDLEEDRKKTDIKRDQIIDEYKKTNNVLSQQLQHFQEENKKLLVMDQEQKKYIEEQKIANQQLEKINNELKEQCAQIQNNVKTYEKYTFYLADQIQRLTSEDQLLEKQIQEFKSANKDLFTLSDKLAKRISTLDETNANALKKIHEVVVMLQLIKEEKKDLLATIEKLNNNRTLFGNEIKTLKDINEMQSKHIHNDAEHIQKLQESIHAYEAFQKEFQKLLEKGSIETLTKLIQNLKR